MNIELAFMIKMMMIFGLIFLLAVLTPIIAKFMDKIFKHKNNDNCKGEQCSPVDSEEKDKE